MGVAKPWDELGVGVKGLSRLGIAGSPRNSFRASLGSFLGQVEHWKGYRASRQVSLPNSEWAKATSRESEGGG